MEVINARAALLCNFEVLAHIRELESDHLARAKTAQRIKKEEESSATVHSSIAAGDKGPAVVEVSENLRTVEVEAIQYLSAEFQPTPSQTPGGITQLVKDLASFDLTKAEKLQVVNLAPTAAVELYVIIEELEDRLGDRMEDILNLVRSSLREPASAFNGTQDPESRHPMDGLARPESQEGWLAYDDGDIDAVADEIEFDDTGEGVGVEGDLDMDLDDD